LNRLWENLSGSLACKSLYRKQLKGLPVNLKNGVA